MTRDREDARTPRGCRAEVRLRRDVASREHQVRSTLSSHSRLVAHLASASSVSTSCAPSAGFTFGALFARRTNGWGGRPTALRRPGAHTFGRARARRALVRVRAAERERARSRRVLGRAVDPSRGIALGHSAEDRSRRPFGSPMSPAPRARCRSVRPRPRVLHVRRTGRRRRGARRGRPGVLKVRSAPRGPARPHPPPRRSSRRIDRRPTGPRPRSSGAARGFPASNPPASNRDPPSRSADVPPADPASNPPLRTPASSSAQFSSDFEGGNSRARAW